MHHDRNRGGDDGLLRYARSRLRSLQGFDEDEWPAFDDLSYLSWLDHHYSWMYGRDDVTRQR